MTGAAGTGDRVDPLSPLPGGHPVTCTCRAMFGGKAMSNDDDMKAAAGDDVVLRERFQFEDWCERVADDMEGDE